MPYHLSFQWAIICAHINEGKTDTKNKIYPGQEQISVETKVPLPRTEMYT